MPRCSFPLHTLTFTLTALRPGYPTSVGNGALERPTVKEH